MKVGGFITLHQSARFSQDCTTPGTSINVSPRYNDILQHATGAVIPRLQLIHRNTMEHSVHCVCVSGLFRKVLSSVNMHNKVLDITVIVN